MQRIENPGSAGQKSAWTVPHVIDVDDHRGVHGGTNFSTETSFPSDSNPTS